MPQKKPSPRPQRQPTYRLHKARGCAVVTINGNDHYLGKYNSPESHEKYARLIAEWQANGKELSSLTRPDPNGDLTVSALILRYLDFAQDYYNDYATRHQGETNDFFLLSPLSHAHTGIHARAGSHEYVGERRERRRESVVL